MSLRRVQREATDLHRAGQQADDAPVLSQVLSVAVDPEDPFYWTVTAVPTVDTCTSVALFGVEVTLCLRFPKDYPFKPFTVSFEDAFLHRVRHAFDPPTTPQSIALWKLLSAIGEEQVARGDIQREWQTIWDAAVPPPQPQLHHANVSEGAENSFKTVERASGEEAPYHLRVKTLTGRHFTLDHLGPSDTVAQLVSAVSAATGRAPAEMRLIYAGKQLYTGAADAESSAATTTLASAGVRDDADDGTIHVVYRIPGGQCDGDLLGKRGALKEQWSPMNTAKHMLLTLNESLFAAEPPPDDRYVCRCHLRPLHDAHATLDLVQWAGRCSSPARGVVWSPSNDARWPLLFRRIVRYVRRIAVRAESHATRRTLPLDVVERIASYL